MNEKMTSNNKNLARELDLNRQILFWGAYKIESEEFYLST
jgi:hypothetical protein